MFAYGGKLANKLLTRDSTDWKKHEIAAQLATAKNAAAFGLQLLDRRTRSETAIQISSTVIRKQRHINKTHLSKQGFQGSQF